MTTKRLFTALFILALYAMGVRETLDPDMWWHLRTGESILQSGIPRQDLFSFTVADHAWVTHEWLSQVFMWLVYRAGGLPGLIIVFAGLIALTYGLVYGACVARPFLPAFVVLLSAVVSAIVWGARPQIFNLLFAAVFVLVVERVKTGQARPRWLWLLPLFTVLWANFHSGYLLGVVVLGTYAVGEAAQRWLSPQDERSLPWSLVGQLVGVTAVTFLSAALNPSGPTLWLYPFETLTSPAMRAFIQEWHSPDFHLTMFWPFAAMLGLGVLAWVYSDRRPTGSELLLFSGTAAAGLMSARNIPLFALIAAPIMTRHLASALRRTPLVELVETDVLTDAPPRAPLPAMTVLNGVLLVVAAVGVMGWTAVKIIGNEAAITERFPVTAVDYLEQSGLAQTHGYHSYNWGGYLIWRGVPVFIDGRADVYGDDFIFYYRQAMDITPSWRDPLAAYQVAYVLMETDSPLFTVLAASGDWQPVYTDDLAEIWVPLP